MYALIPRLIGQSHRIGQMSGQLEAVSLFIDISGFTALTEALMVHQKDGAEVLTSALNTTFQPLVAQVYAAGGFISMFAGDAFTALFPIDEQHAASDAARAALQAAIYIQQFFIDYGVLETKYGTFTLSVKVGMGLGRAEWGILGSTSADTATGPVTFFFRGPAVDSSAEAEHHAAKGDIIADARVIDLLGAHVEYTPAAPAGATHCRVLAMRGTAAQAFAASPPPSLPEDTLRRFVADSVLNLIASGAAAEFRQVAPVFLSFDEPSSTEALNHFVSTVLQLTISYGGYFNKLDFGDKGGVLLLLFGAPVAHENDVERAADFLLALRGAQVGVAWRAGLTSGIVYAGLMGGNERCEYTAIGDVVNLAARLMMQAAWGNVWLSPLAAQRLRGKGYETEALGAFHFKGKSIAVAVSRLVGKKVAADSQFYSGEMIGRDTQLKQLLRWADSIRHGRFAGVSILYGEPGMGKSRLAHEVQRWLTRKRRMGWILCKPDEIVRQSLNPFKHMLRQHFAQSPNHSTEENKARFEFLLHDLTTQVADIGPEIAQELERTRSFLGSLLDLRWEGSLYEQLEPKMRFENTLLAIKTLLQAESLLHPLVVQIEDLQWLDTDSLQLITFLSRTLAGYPVWLLCVSRYRDDGSQVPLEVAETALQHILELSSLTNEDVQTYANQVLTGQADRELTRFLVEKTHGNPFFVEQLLLDMRERGAIVPLPGNDTEVWAIASQGLTEVPTGINAVLVARLDRLATEVKQVVQTAAVLGREFAVHVLSGMIRNDDQVIVKVKSAETERIWSNVSSIRYLFRHTLLRDASYEMQLRARLRELHALAAAAILEVYRDDLSPHYADLAYHYAQAEDHENECRYAELAGERAAASYANYEAVAYLSRALELTPGDNLAQHYHLLRAREQIYDLQGNRSAQAHDLDTLAAVADQMHDEQRQAEVLLRRANYADRVGDYPAMIEVARAAIRLSQALQHQGAEAAGHLHWARALWYQGDYAEAQEQAQQALNLAHLSSSWKVQAETLRILGNVALYRGDYAEARWAFEESLEQCNQIDDWYGKSAASNNLGIVAFYQGDYPAARSHYEQALHISKETGDRQGESIALVNLGEVAASQGDYRAAQDAFQRSLQLYRETGDRYGESLALFNLGEVAAAHGSYAAARQTYEESLHISRGIGHRQHESWVLAKLGLLFHRLDDHQAAREHSQQALDLAQDVHDRNIQGIALTHLGHALAALDEPQSAAAAYQQALELRRALEQPHQAMEPLAGLARLALAQHDREQARALVEDILHHLETQTLDGTDEPFRIYLTCYNVLQASGDPRAHTLLQKAYMLLQARATRLDDEALRHSFLHHVAAHRELLALWQARQTEPTP